MRISLEVPRYQQGRRRWSNLKLRVFALSNLARIVTGFTVSKHRSTLIYPAMQNTYF